MRTLTNEEIIKTIRTTGDENRELIARLYSQNTGLIRTTAAPYINAGMDEDDAMQEGFIALLQAVEHYNPEAGAFSTYFPYWIRATIARTFNDAAHIKRLPAWIQAQARQYKQFCADYEREYGCKPSDSFLRARLKLSQEKLDDLRRIMQEANALSLADPIPGAEDMTIADAVADPADMIEAAIEEADRAQAAREIWAAVDGLQNEQTDVLKLRYQESQTIRATAERLGMTPGKVEREEQKGLRRLRSNRAIKLIANDYGFTTCQLYGGSLTRFRNTGTSMIEDAVIRRLEGHLSIGH